MTQQFYYQLFKQVDAQTVIVTPNRRLSATLQRLYQTYQVEQKNHCWSTPTILPIMSWFEKLWQDYTHQHMSITDSLLSAIQQQYLWEKVLASSTDLLHISKTAELARSAYHLLQQWQIKTNHILFESAPDYAAMQDWMNAYQQLCEKKSWLDESTLVSKLIEYIQENGIKLPKKLFLLGFNEISPQWQLLLNHAKSTGTDIENMQYLPRKTQVVRLTCADITHEITTMARWAKLKLNAHPHAQIGCVIPQLETYRDRAQQIFSEVFADVGESAFNISAGKPLNQYPIIHAALQLLQLYQSSLNIEPFNYILLSPFLGEAESERIKRANYEYLLRRNNIIKIDLINFLNSSHRLSLTTYCPQLSNRLNQFYQLWQQQPAKQSFEQWAKFFNQSLSLLGWPGERSLLSQEYQIVESWLKLLAAYMALDYLEQNIHIREALQALNKAAAHTIFQPQTPLAPVQVLGLLEASALPFDFLWISGMDDLSWPPAPQPNPFIPKRLQREYHMPHATAERELQYCQHLTTQFCYAADQTIFSYAERNEELHLDASPLIRQFNQIEFAQLNLPLFETITEALHKKTQVETIMDNIAPPYQLDRMIGGVDILKQQAICPFKAFAKHRLYIEDVEPPLPGMHPRERGIVIHKVLELIWSELKTQTTLLALSSDSLTELIEKCVSTALNNCQNSRHSLTTYLELEKKRLQKLAADWLNLEKLRKPFTVLMHEKNITIDLNGLNFSLRIDRIDELMDGTKLVIDYKTGKSNDINDWFSERPVEPQLPLYALFDKQIAGISYAQIATGEHTYIGLSAHDLEIKGIRLIADAKKATADSWQEQYDQWQIILTKLSKDFLQGIAHVDPKDAQSCNRCSYKSLCRISEDVCN